MVEVAEAEAVALEALDAEEEEVVEGLTEEVPVKRVADGIAVVEREMVPLAALLELELEAETVEEALLL
jgi:hypothetical protein